MRLALYLFGKLTVRRLLSGSGLLLAVLAASLLFAGLLAATERTQALSSAYERVLGGEPVSIPVQTMERGSAHAQVWEATDYVYHHNYPVIGGILLPLRFTAKWLLVILPLVGLILSAHSVSSELESGVAQTVYGAPVPRSLLGITRALGDSVAATILIATGIAFALWTGAMLTGFEFSVAQLTRGIAFVLILALYTSIFVLVGTLLSATTRRSSRALWACIIVSLAVFAIYFSGENVMSTVHQQYPAMPLAPRDVGELLTSRPPGLSSTRSGAQLEAAGGEALAAYLAEVNENAETLHAMILADYQAERWYELISPVHAVWEIAQQLLQDRHEHSTEVLAPLAPMDPAPPLSVSLLAVWPELTGLALVWLALLAANACTLARLEV